MKLKVLFLLCVFAGVFCFTSCGVSTMKQKSFFEVFDSGLSVQQDVCDVDVVPVKFLVKDVPVYPVGDFPSSVPVLAMFGFMQPQRRSNIGWWVLGIVVAVVLFLFWKPLKAMFVKKTEEKKDNV